MVQIRRAFTLIELLVVIAIIAVISAVLFPVLSSAKASAARVACVSNLSQISRGVLMYTSDYDDRLMPANHKPAGGEANSRTDRTWVQLLLPYARNFTVFRCPADSNYHPRLDAIFDQDLVPGDTYSQFYSASMRSNYGYNYHNLAPIVQEGDEWVARPKLVTEVGNPSDTILFVDSVWQTTADGKPEGGGNWLVVPPCRYYDSAVDSFTQSRGGSSNVYTPILGWSVSGGSNVVPPYGNAFPWHNGRMNVARLDGSIASMSPKQLGAGCDVKNAWQGLIGDPGAYMWDIR